MAQDAAAVAARLGVSDDEAARQLRLQAASAAVTDDLARRFGDRLAGIAIEHRPAFRIVVRLTGDAPVADETVMLDGEPVAVAFVPGAAATQVEIVQAITAYQATIRASLISPPGLGVDQRSGELVAVVSGRDVAREGAEALRARLAALTHVPVRLRVVDQPALDMDEVAGGMRLMGRIPGDARRFLCTAGFVVTDGMRTGIATAAHCPDALSVRGADGREAALPFVGQWGWGHQDVQINLATDQLAPVFFADTAKAFSRPVTDARSRAGTRAGDVVCHRGERTGYSCSEVELTDFAPAGDLCGGACLPTWTTVAGPTCKGGDSGSPVFLGTTAYGILKGGSYRTDGSCAFYFYMSTDYLPTGWRLLTAGGVVPPPIRAQPVEGR
nr:hypothetical protein [Sphingomonas liriopis]